VGDPVHIAHAFFRQVRPAAQRRVVEVAAKHAMLEPELPDDASISSVNLADRMARCLRIFAAEDRQLVASAITKSTQRWSKLPVSMQCRVLARLGDLDAFWAGIREPEHRQLDGIVRSIGEKHEGLENWREPKLGETEAAALSLVAVDEVRAALPSLETALAGLTAVGVPR
jgi:hypothetical protein